MSALDHYVTLTKLLDRLEDGTWVLVQAGTSTLIAGATRHAADDVRDEDQSVALAAALRAALLALRSSLEGSRAKGAPSLSMTSEAIRKRRARENEGARASSPPSTKPLSMTPEAIRKRRARTAAKAALQDVDDQAKGGLQ